jgi:hypothetical protein
MEAPVRKWTPERCDVISVSGRMYAGAGKKVDARGVLLDRTHAGFNLNNINHELCRYADDVTRMLLSTPATSTMNSATALMTSHACCFQRQQQPWEKCTLLVCKIPC